MLYFIVYFIWTVWALCYGSELEVYCTGNAQSLFGNFFIFFCGILFLGSVYMILNLKLLLLFFVISYFLMNFVLYNLYSEKLTKNIFTEDEIHEMNKPGNKIKTCVKYSMIFCFSFIFIFYFVVKIFYLIFKKDKK